MCAQYTALTINFTGTDKNSHITHIGPQSTAHISNAAAVLTDRCLQLRISYIPLTFPINFENKKKFIKKHTTCFKTSRNEDEFLQYV